MVDWSAASTLGPKKETPDRCWLAQGDATQTPTPEYFRGRRDAERRVGELIATAPGNVLVGFDFPFGYPGGSGLGGGRVLAERLAGLIEDAPDGHNNRFIVAAQLNAELGTSEGPFWGCPRAIVEPMLKPTKPRYDERFQERRIVDRTLAHRGIMPPWQLLGRGSVGGQMLLGLPMLHRLTGDPRFGSRVRIWPFETGWDDDLTGVVLAEIWPSLNDHACVAHPIKDARQVVATCDWLLRADAAGRLAPYLTRPRQLSPNELRTCEREEGWLVGAEAASEGRLPLA